MSLVILGFPLQSGEFQILLFMQNEVGFSAVAIKEQLVMLLT
jgi:hypothetical protein